MKELILFKNYLEVERNLSHNTVNAYITDLKQFFSYTNKTSLKKITVEDIILFIVRLREQGCSTNSTNRKLSALKTFFKYMMKIGKVKSNPAELIESGKIEKRLPKPLTVSDIEKIINVTDNLRDKVMFEILYGTGIRREELVNIKVSDINFEQSIIRIFGKGGKERIVPIHKKALNMIKELIKEQNSIWLFPSPRKNNHLSVRQVNTIVEKWSIKAGIEKVTPHMFRHSFCSHLYENGAELKVIQDLAGHANPNTTQIYTKVSNQRNITEYLQYHPRAREGA